MIILELTWNFDVFQVQQSKAKTMINIYHVVLFKRLCSNHLYLFLCRAYHQYGKHVYQSVEGPSQDVMVS